MKLGPCSEFDCLHVSDPCVIDFLFVVDGSDSVKDAFRPQVEFVSNVVKQLTIGPEYQRVALIQYSTDFRIRLEFNFHTFSNQEKVLVSLVPYPSLSVICNAGSAFRKRITLNKTKCIDYLKNGKKWIWHPHRYIISSIFKYSSSYFSI